MNLEHAHEASDLAAQLSGVRALIQMTSAPYPQNLRLEKPQIVTEYSTGTRSDFPNHITFAASEIAPALLAMERRLIDRLGAIGVRL